MSRFFATSDTESELSSSESEEEVKTKPVAKQLAQSSLAWPDHFFPFFFGIPPPQRKTETS